MRYVCPAAVLAFSILAPSAFSGQLSVVNYQVVSQTPAAGTKYAVTYQADLQNSGTALDSVKAVGASNNPFTFRMFPGADVLNFAPVPANGQTTSTNTFTILVDPSVPFSFSDLVWTFQSTAGTPKANAGLNQTVIIGATVMLNGAGSSNPSGVGTLSYAWTFTSRPPGSRTSLQNSGTVAPTFIADASGNYVIQLTVSNGAASSSASVTVSTTNSPPVANAGPNQSVKIGATVVLNGSASSDVDGDPLTYHWTIVSQPAGSVTTLSGANNVSASFVIDKAGAYVMQLIVNDGLFDSAAAFVTVTTQNSPPLANAGPNQVVLVGALVQLDGSKSTDVNGDPLTYRWNMVSLPANSTATLSNPTGVNPTFTADLQGTYVVQLIVNDGLVDSLPATVTIATNSGQPPTANAGPNQTVVHGTTVSLNGSGTDPQNLPLTFQWSLISKPLNSTVALSSTLIANPTFVADLPGSYVAQLITKNNFLSSAPSTVTITTTDTAPVANAGPNQSVIVGTLVKLDGSGSSDADNDPITTYAWSLTSRPNGSTATLSSANTVAPTFTADVAGAYVAQLIVSDKFASSNPATVMVTAALTPMITLTPNPLNLTKNGTGTLTMTLSAPAGQGGQIVNLSSSNTSVATVPFNATIPAGSTGTNVTITSGNTGGSTISASSPGFGAATVAVNVVTPTISITLDSATVAVARTINATITLNAPATPGGVTVVLGSIPSGIVDLEPPNVTIPAGGTTGTFTVTGLSEGSATIVVRSPGYVSGSANIAVAAGLSFPPGSTTIPTGTTLNIPLNLSGPAPPGLKVNLSSSDSSIATVPATLSFPSQALTANVPVTGVKPGSVTITASAPNITSATANVTIGGGSPASITLTGGGQSAAVTQAFANPIVVTVKDTNGNGVAGIAVQISGPGSGASATFVAVGSANTNAQGQVTFTATANTLAGGPYTITATATGVAGSATGQLTNTPGSGSAITLTGGGQSAAVTQAFANPIVVTVKDTNGNGVAGIAVQISGPGSGASATFVAVGSANTNAQGQVTFTATANTLAGGPYTITATATGVAGSATGQLTNPPGSPSIITPTGGTPQSTQINTPFPLQLSVIVKDANGNLMSGVTVRFTQPPSGASGTFDGGVNTAVTNALGVATSTTFTANGTAGSYNVVGTVPGAFSTNFSLTNTAVGTAGTLAVSNPSVGQYLQTTATISLSQPAGIGGVQVTVTSGDATKAAVSGRSSDAGNASVTFTISEGLNTATIFVQGLAASGTVILAASANNYVTGTGTVTLAPSGFVLAGPQGIGVPSFSLGQGASTVLTVSVGRLDSSMNFVEAQPPAVGSSASVVVSSSTTGVGTISTSPLNFTAGVSSLTTQFNAVASGSTTLIAVVPRGFSTPANGENILTASVTPASLLPTNATVGNGLETTAGVALNGAAPSGGLVVTISSNDPSKLLLALTPTDAGSASIMLTIPGGLNHTQNFFVYGLGNSGTVTYTAAGPGFGSAIGTVTLSPSGFVEAGPGGLGVANFTTSTASLSSTVTIFSAILDGATNFVAVQSVAGGSSVNVNVTSSKTAVGTLSPSTVNVAGGTSSADTQFQPLSAGTATISVGVPAGFSAPAQDTALTATVGVPGFSVSGDGVGGGPAIAIGNNLEVTGSVVIGQQAPPGGQSVMLTSNDPSHLLLSATATDAGSTSIIITIPAGFNSASFFMQGFGSGSLPTYTASAPGFRSDTGAAHITDSAVTISGPFGSFPFSTTTSSAASSLTVAMAQLDGSDNFVSTQQLAGGLSLTISLSDSNSAIATVPSSVTIMGGSDRTTAAFTPTAVGQAVISVVRPTGYTNAPIPLGSVTGNVN